MNRMIIRHGIPPVYDEFSKVLVLGSFPSVKSREAGFFYGNPQNRLWRVLAAVFSQDVPEMADGKKLFLLRNGIAMWDCIAECTIDGSADSSIKDVVPNDITIITELCPDIRIFLNGRMAERCFYKYIFPKIGIEAHTLPSTSPANAAYSLDRLIEAWKVIGR